MTLNRERIIHLIREHLSSTAPVEQISFASARKRRKTPSLKQLEWGPDFCFQRNTEYYLIHILAGPELPTRIKKSRSALKEYKNTHIVVLAVSTRDLPAHKIAEKVCGTCANSGFALLCESSYGLVTVLPPRRLVYKKCGSTGNEFGHIPKWILQRLAICRSFSPFLSRQIKNFISKYDSLTKHRRARMYDKEAEILEQLLRAVRRGLSSFYLPLERFLELKSWERQGANQGARDHYFHTFNNLLLGLLILGETFGERSAKIPPDSFVADGSAIGKLKPWEALWLLTCLNHDPGYIGEKFWPAVYSKFGLVTGSGRNRPVPKDVAEELSNGWETDLKRARTDLLDLYRRVSNVWLPPQLAHESISPFDAALRIAYFDGEKSSHSLLSGLTLIQGFIQDQTQTERNAAEYARCLAGCEIAALSMLFHDQRCRELLEKHAVPPIPFEQLPYASLLIFVDALQDDRRNIIIDTWPKHGVLNGLQILNQGRLIRATVCLKEIELKYWPGKLLEYHSAIRWLNSSSEITFEIQWRPEVDF